ncbi:hypothetical protein [Methylomonas sp. CM2]|uniref:hypothetical protein n=1 Tax=Methylomonas sp. CM2 TaxID=3417647 RepID=UPI003CF3115B
MRRQVHVAEGMKPCLVEKRPRIDVFDIESSNFSGKHLAPNVDPVFIREISAGKDECSVSHRPKFILLFDGCDRLPETNIERQGNKEV